MINNLTKAQTMRVNKLFRQWDNKSSPGCVVGILKDHKLIYAKGYGIADLEHNIPNDINSVFKIGSVAKQFTAACIQILAKKRKLSLNDTLSKYFPEFPKYAEKITIKHLLHHTNGLRDWVTLTNFTDKDIWNTDDFDVLYLIKNQKELNYEPGEEYSYTNSGYYLLGKIVEKVSKVPLSQFAEENIFKPLEMNNTHFHDNSKKIIKNRAHGYTPNAKKEFDMNFCNSQVVGDGGIFTTIADILKWDTNFYTNNIGGKNFTQIMERQGTLNSGKKILYASGLNIFKHKGLKMVAHGGLDFGYRTEYQRFPKYNFSSVVMTNRQDIDPYVLCTSIADIFLKDHYIDIKPKKIKKEKVLPNKIDIPTNKLKEFTGSYRLLKNSMSRKIYLKDNSLWYLRYPGSENELIPYSNNEFKMIGLPVDAKIAFSKNKNKENVFSISIDGSNPDIFISYKIPKYTQKALKQFTGKYYSQEVDSTYEFRIFDKELTMYYKDHKINKLNPVTKGIFNLSDFINFEFINFIDNKYNGILISTIRCFNIKYERID